MNAAQFFKKFFLFSFFLLLFSPVFSSPALAVVTLFLEPSSGAYQIGESFDLSVKLNTGGAETVGVDALMIFNPVVLTLNNITFGDLYSDNTKNLTEANSSGKFYFSSANVSSAFPFANTTPETLAILKFTAKANGTSPVRFDCTDGVLVDTNVWEQGTRGGDAVDLLVCSNATGGSYQVGEVTVTPTPTNTPGPTSTPTPTPGAGVPTSTPTPTNTPGPTATPTPTPVQKLPETGMVANTLILSIIGGGLILLGLSLAF